MPERYWQVDLNHRIDISFDEAAQHLRKMFLNSVSLHLRSDVPVGAALSGGIDSTSIVASMRYLYGQSLEIHTFSYIADDPKLSEERWVDIASNAAGVNIHKVMPDAREMFDELEYLTYILDEPFGGSSIYAQHRVFRLAQEKGIKVTLDGQGADELLAGYPDYLSDRLVSLIRRGKLLQGMKFIWNARQFPDWNARMLLMIAGERFLPMNLRKFGRRVIGEQDIPNWMDGDWFRERDGIPEGIFYRRLQDVQSIDVLREQLYYSLFVAGIPNLLRLEDRNSMAHSIESRVPFLIPDIVSFVFSLPEEYIIDVEGTTKAVFRRAMEGIVPGEILQRRDKIGFTPPEKQWLSVLSRWVESLLASDVACSIPVWNLQTMQNQLQTVVEGKKSMDLCYWRWLGFIAWVKRFGVSFE